jgi:methionine--tRNA ligase beta chain
MSETVSFRDFKKLEFMVSTVTKVEQVPDSDKLYKMIVDVGSKEIQIVSGLVDYYEPEELQGKRIVVCTNLAPAKIFGQLSEGMLLAAETKEGDLALLTTDREIKNGAKIT